ncbi:hypothetical protein BC938DRAFT_477702 [Jimgerdemannia flammicorona]|uniref:Uncharacterized protein n=1 Tax=Jimgerdemannia flammicorona TaxID=994334 RepID=A0A433P8A2_9FUNG|nr:hypothetical protein BC938DRAFT_477702 [Jimgerdemannia flammicorona]
MTSSKALQIEKEIDAARCKASWSTIPELTRRYKKHNSEGSVLEQTVLAELTLTQTLSRYHREKGWYSSVYDDDTPDRISLPPRLPPELLKDVVTQLQNALKLELSPKAKVVPMAAMQKEFATIILARAHFESGTYAKTLELLDTTNVPLERASTGYAFVLLIMSKTIKGISLEMTGEITQALEFYDQVPTLLSQRPSEKSDELLNWSEEALYRAALLRARLGERPQRELSISNVDARGPERL